MADLAAYIDQTSKGFDKSAAETVECISVYGKFPLIETRGIIIDTPGRGAVYDQDYITREILPQVDVILCPIAADYPLSSDEAGFLMSLPEQEKSKLLFIVTKIDELDTDKLSEVVSRIQTIVNKITGGAPRLFKVAAKKVTDAYKDGKSSGEVAGIKERRDCGLKELENALDTKLREASVVESLIRLCCKNLAGQFAADKKRLEESKMELTLDLTELEHRQKELDDLCRGLNDSYTKHFRDLQREWNKEVKRFITKIAAKEARIIHDLGEAQGNLLDLIGFEKKLSRKVQTMLDGVLSQDLLDLNGKLEDMAAKFARELNSDIDSEIEIYGKSGSPAGDLASRAKVLLGGGGIAASGIYYGASTLLTTANTIAAAGANIAAATANTGLLHKISAVFVGGHAVAQASAGFSGVLMTSIAPLAAGIVIPIIAVKLGTAIAKREVDKKIPELVTAQMSKALSDIEDKAQKLLDYVVSQLKDNLDSLLQENQGELEKIKAVVAAKKTPEQRGRIEKDLSELDILTKKIITLDNQR
jgi:hypothetical protein